MAAETRFDVPGMKCGGCVAKVQETLKSLPGVSDVSVDLTTKTAIVRGEVRPGDVEAALSGAGYPAVAKT
ncbi:copper-binding protein [Sulfurifustis variabilis]|uniref:Copper-binding protein n=1 Tax=Sulfurifustis variabilis TaxID=1675686 RepID=A0A1B4VCZ1_9GAMM|nr:heavy metal-associated domain-containing protein [Sulfurifustis variabilis]BAU49971.1 copper-binding protein [Sulfurifustis variabilis]